MIGAIAGDIIGSVYEWNNIKTTEFPLFTDKSVFTDDTVMTIATAAKLLYKTSYIEEYQYFGSRYPKAGYGKNFAHWLTDPNPKPYKSYGNGSAMRVSPIAWWIKDLKKCLLEAKRSAKVTHNHPEGIKGAKAVCLAIKMAQQEETKDKIKETLIELTGYDLNRKIKDIRKTYIFNVSCQGSVPEAIIAFLEGNDFEECIRLAISLGGDSDTIACITGSIAEAYYDIPVKIIKEIAQRLPKEFIDIIKEFNKRGSK